MDTARRALILEIVKSQPIVAQHVKVTTNQRVMRQVRLDYMGLSFHDLIILKELDDGGVREPRRLKSLCLKRFVFIRWHLTKLHPGGNLNLRLRRNRYVCLCICLLVDNVVIITRDNDKDIGSYEAVGRHMCHDTQGGGGHRRRTEVEVITEQVSSSSSVICEERQSPLICCLAKRSMMDKESELS